MRCAIVGSGLIARAHAKTLAEMGHSIACVVNPHLESARALAQECGAGRVATSLEEALTSDVDCVHVCTPPALHYGEVKAALEAGKHVVCEKPLCLDPAEAWELAALAAERGLIAAVGFNARFHEACARAREKIAAPELGGIALVHGSYFQEYHALPDTLSWRYRPALAGPMRAVTEIGSHWLDLARFWTGLEIAAVSASFSSFVPERAVEGGIMRAPSGEGTEQRIRVSSEDAASISLRFSNGAMGNLLLSEASHGRANSLSLEVVGRDESLWWNSEEPYKLHSARKGEGVRTETMAFGGGYSDTFHSLFEAVYADIARRRRNEAVDADRPAYPNFADGAANAAICAAIYESANKDSAWVRVESGAPAAVHPDTARMIELFGLGELPVEGALYKSTYCSGLKSREGGPACTDMIGMYSERPRSLSCFHRLDYDEIWHAVGGDPFRLVLLYPDGRSEDVVMGTDPAKGQRLQFVVPAKVWQGGCILPGGRYSLFTCTMAPGFTGSCFEAGVSEELVKLYPERREDILRLSVNGEKTRMPEGFAQ
jgi:predicted dehydrogenase/predicted cupin superfamily sugar epimerase